MNKRVLALLLGAVVLALVAGTPGWAQRPIKFGFMAPLT